MAHFQELRPEIEVMCSEGHISQKYLENGIFKEVYCDTCDCKIVSIHWIGLKPHNIDSIEEKG